MRYFIAGGAGFIGSHMVDCLISNDVHTVTIYDNFSSGNRLSKEHYSNSRINIIEGDLQNLDQLTQALKNHDFVYHFASNPDIAKAMTTPSIDFWEGTYLTQNLIEAMRACDVKKIAYASGSGIYGDTGLLAVHEDCSPMLPISTYGASKLSCEALICSYCYLFDMQAFAFRFANVIGPRQTHGVAYDFIRRLLADSSKLEVMGDGSQSKSYIHVSDIVQGVQCIVQNAKDKFNYFNLATEDYIDVKTIAAMVIDKMKLDNVDLLYSGGDRGWKGDVPIVRFDLSKIYSLGWKASKSSLEAMDNAIEALIPELEQELCKS